MTHPPPRSPAEAGRTALPVLLLLLVAAAGGGAWALGLFGLGAEEGIGVPLSPPLVPGPLRISILETGELESLEPVTVLSPVEGQATIDYIVPEGTVLTEADVAAGTVIVRLNTSEVQEKKDRQHREWTDATAALANARANLEIQLDQNQSDLRTRRLEVRFTTLDLERYVGQELAEALMAFTLPPPDAGPGGLSPDEALRREVVAVLGDPRLAGEARQRLRELESEIQLAEEELRRAEDKLKHSERLEAKGYVSREDLEADRLAFQRRTIERERAITARQQYVSYDFVKEVARLYSEHMKAQDELRRAERSAEAVEAKARADVRAREEQEGITRQRYERYVAMESACEIRAPAAGLVVYGSTGQERGWRGRERIERNAQVRERQEILRIPRPGDLGAKVSVHESRVEAVRAGQRAWVMVGARTERRLAGRVRTVANMADSQSSWWNPDLKVYTCQISFDEPQPDLKPGMSAQIEIVIDELEDVLAVPLQAVGGSRARPLVYTWDDSAGAPVPHAVTLGRANDHLVEVRAGLEPGWRVVLAPPPAPPAPAGRAAAGPARGDAGGAGAPAAPGAGGAAGAPRGRSGGPRR